MYKNLVFVFTLILGIAISFVAYSDQSKHQAQPPHMALDYFVQLEGAWVGTHINHEGKEEQVDLLYRTVSGGTAVEERIFADTPQEMITVYHGSVDDGLLMTHYCILGNQPRLKLQNSHEMVLDFKFLDGAGIDRKKTGHMGGMKLTILDENTIQQEWDYYENGDVKNTSTFTFKRK